MDLRALRFDNLPRRTQVIVAVLMAGALVAATYYFYLQSKVEELASLRSEITRLEASVSQGTAIASQLPRFKAELAQLEKRLAELRSILPSQKETPIVLRSVQEMAASSNLKILRFGPQAVVPRAFYSDWPIVMEVQGSYNALGMFFEKISKFTRIINVDKITVRGIDGSTDSTRSLTAVCTATTFVFREDSADAAAGKEK